MKTLPPELLREAAPLGFVFNQKQTHHVAPKHKPDNGPKSRYANPGASALRRALGKATQ
jgi:hypothetical protein